MYRAFPEDHREARLARCGARVATGPGPQGLGITLPFQVLTEGSSSLGRQLRPLPPHLRQARAFQGHGSGRLGQTQELPLLLRAEASQEASPSSLKTSKLQQPPPPMPN